MKPNKLIIFDPVGVIAGMDFYSKSLALSLRSVSIDTFIISNFEEKNLVYKFFNSEKKRSKAYKFFDLCLGVVKGLAVAKKKKINYVLVHIFTTEVKDLIPILFSKILGLKAIVVLHDVSGFSNSDSKVIKKIIFNHLADRIVVHNEFSKTSLLQIFPEKILKKTSVIPHGSFLKLANSNITKTTSRKDLGIDQSSKIILFFGQIKEVKGLDILLNAMKYLDDDITLIIAGRPWKHSFDSYQKFLEEHNLLHKVKLLIRYISNHERELLLKSADLLIIPYKKIYQSGVLLLGMSFGVTILASDLEPNRDIVKNHQNGLLFKTNNSKDLGKKINLYFQFYADNRLAVNGLESLRLNYCWDTIAQLYKNKVF